MAGLSLRHVRKVYPARHKSAGKGKTKVARVNDDFVAVKDFTMEIEDGEFIVFVGPSGCGKSTTLRMIAGLEDISSGELYIGGKLMNNVEPRDRDIAMVFQSYALYPHMTAYENIAFGLRMRKISEPKLDEFGNNVIGKDVKKIKELTKRIARTEKDIAAADKCARRDVTAHLRMLSDEVKRETDEDAKSKLEARIASIDVEGDIRERSEAIKSEAEARLNKLKEELEYYQNTPVQLYVERHYTNAEIDEKVKWAAEILGITELLNSKPSEMSGGQRQRIALGRAMVRGAKVFLLDEPLSNLDAKLRTAMRSEIVKLHNALKTTFIYVTHDQIEAMTMGTRIVVLKDGYIQQIDTPTNLFDFPQNKFVAGFIGTPQMNFFNVTVKRDGGFLRTTFEDGQSLNFALKDMRTVRPDILDGQEHKVIMGARGESMSIGGSGLKMTVNIMEVLGDNTHVFVRLNGKEYIVCLNDRCVYRPDDEVYVAFNEKKIHFFDSETEESLLGRDLMDQVDEQPVASTSESADKTKKVAAKPAKEEVSDEEAVKEEPAKEKPAKKSAGRKTTKKA